MTNQSSKEVYNTHPAHFEKERCRTEMTDFEKQRVTDIEGVLDALDAESGSSNS